LTPRLGLALPAEQFSAVLEHLQHARLTFLSNIEQAGLILGRYADCMTTVRHYPGTSPEPTQSSFPGYPLGVWPPLISSFAKKMLRTKRDIVIAACQVAPAHATPDRDEARAVGNQQRETKGGAIPERPIPARPADVHAWTVRGVGSRTTVQSDW
jgi:hypothetical protein